MAEAVTSELVKVIFEKLADEAFKKYVRSQGIYSELKQLESSLLHIQALLNDASDKEIKDGAIKQWLNDLQHVAYDIDDVLDEVVTEAMHQDLGTITSKVRKLIPTSWKTLSSSHKLRHRLDSITTELEQLYKAKADLGLIVKDEKEKIPNRGNGNSLPDSIVVGREVDKEKLLNKLLGDDGDQSSMENFTIVPIVGIGGVGKTTLARLLYNDPKVQDHFDLKAWVSVSDDFDISKISKIIFQAVSGDIQGFGNLNHLQRALAKQFEGKRFLLVLDDVWTENVYDWENLVRPFHLGALGSRVIVTTRNNHFLKKLGFDHVDQLDSLSDKDALSLFCLHALGVDNFDSHLTLRPKGVSIVEKCGNLPLALKAVGRLLRTKTYVEDWNALLESEIWDLENANGILSSLRLSYLDLPVTLKHVFSYCSLFPKDFLFDKEDLVLLWMAEGFLHTTDATKSSESMGHEYFEILLSRSFFQHAPNDESLFVMHGLMNDLATYVANDFFIRFDKETGMMKEASEKDIRHMSFIREEYVAYQKFKTFQKANRLRTLLAVSAGMNQSWDTFYLSSKILFDLPTELPLLRVLSLSRFEISEVPDFIGGLSHLRYLNLSQTKIKMLPQNVGDLYNLETLIVFGCKCLTKLPESFIKLKLLRHFDIRDTPLLERLPLGIDQLKNLHTLTKIIIGGDNDFVITKPKGLQDIQGEISIAGLQNVQSPMHAQEVNVSLERLTKLELTEDSGSGNGILDNEVLNELKPNSDRLKELAIVSYGGTKFPNWVEEPSFHCLVHVSIRGCRNCTSLPPLGQLASLKKLFIQGMDKVKVIGLELTGTTNAAFLSLESLGFEDMPGWEIWLTNNHDSIELFPRLRELHIKDCPKLIKVSVEELPSLRILQIDRCDGVVLRSLVHVASSITKLEVLSIFGLTYEVWRGVMEYLGAVEEVRMYRCNEISYLWESEVEASMLLVNLKKLYVYDCSNLVSLGKKEEEGNVGSNLLSSLLILDVWHCKNMEGCYCPNSIESLSIGSCTSVTHVSFPTKPTGGHKLKSLDISLCNKHMEKINNTSMPMLEYVFINCWTNLRSITELGNFIHVTHLEVYGCPRIESFPDIELSKLISLQFLIIEKCPSMDYSFPRGLWPPKLVSLGIGGLRKPISEWGSQNFPTSLVSLTFCGEPQVTNFNQLSHLLPSSLTQLGIEEFDNLESLSVGLQHLKSLQHLFIEKCPMMKHLPVSLLPSLLSLIIEECPYLEERCNGRGSHYWPLISHIPRIEIECSD